MAASMHGMWSSRLMFILATAGSAVGLGNIWRFPYVAGENGGGVFVLTYLLCILLIGLPILISETLLGRAGRQSPINTMRTLTARSGVSSLWQVIGWMGVLAGFMILSFYAVISGWILAYLLEMARGSYALIAAWLGGLAGSAPPASDGASAEAAFASLINNPYRVVGWYSAFMLITFWIAARGVGRGLELAVRYLMPALFFLLLALVAWAALTSGHFQAGLAFLFSFKAEQFSGDAILMAMGQAFFTLSLGMGAIMAYGAYLPDRVHIVGSCATIALLDTGVALLAGLVIFPLVFANGLDSGEGPGLMFVTLPIAFGQMPGGQLFGLVFFLLVTFAAITSAISILEPALAWLVEKLQVSRPLGAALVGGMAWLVGLGSAFSFNLLADFQLFPGLTFFDTMDFVANNILLPLGGMLIAIFASWKLSRGLLAEQIGVSPVTRIWLFLARFVAPAGVAFVFIMFLAG